MEELEDFVCYAEGGDGVSRAADRERNLGVVGKDEEVSPGIGECELLKVGQGSQSLFSNCWPLTSGAKVYG